MKIFVTFEYFRSVFQRSENYNSFSYFGLQSLYNYLDEYESEDYIFDYIEIHGRFTEIKKDELNDFLSNYGDINSLEELEDRTIVLNIYDDYEQKNVSGYIIDTEF